MAEDTAARLARSWIEHWNAGTPDEIPLADDFVHESPFGRVEGRARYLEWVKPLAAKNVQDLRGRQVLSNGTEAAIRFEMHSRGGIIEVCDWVTVKDETITAIRSFYDPTGLR